MSQPTPPARWARRLLPALGLAVLGSAWLIWTGRASPPSGPVQALSASASCATRTYAEIGGPFELVGPSGETVTEADLKGRDSLVFFGFTYCPDVCPMALFTLGQAIDQLPEGVPAPRTVLITVDPERDTPEVLATYLSDPSFPQDSLGLTGSSEAIRAVANAFKADYRRVNDDSSAAGYTMDHTSIIYLMDENWELKSFFTHEDSPVTISNCLADLAPTG